MAQQESPGGSTFAGVATDVVQVIERALPGSRPETAQFLAEAAHFLSVRTDQRVFRQGEPIPLTVLSRSYLPSLVGTSREMTGRVLRELERDGVLARDGRTGLKLLRPDRLDGESAGPSRGAT